MKMTLYWIDFIYSLTELYAENKPVMEEFVKKMLYLYRCRQESDAYADRSLEKEERQ